MTNKVSKTVTNYWSKRLEDVYRDFKKRVTEEHQNITDSKERCEAIRAICEPFQKRKDNLTRQFYGYPTCETIRDSYNLVRELCSA